MSLTSSALRFADQVTKRNGGSGNENDIILVPRGRAPFGQHQESRPLARSNAGSPRFTDFPLLCACSESSLTNLIGSGINPLCLQSHSKQECRWTWPEVAILGADQKERGLWEREWNDVWKHQGSETAQHGEEIVLDN